MEPTNIRYFKTPRAFRTWLKRYHRTGRELWVGYYKKSTGRESITWSESVDQALCFGWIDGLRKRVDDMSFTVRFTPRRTDSIWSTVNVRRVQSLIRSGDMEAAGLAAFKARKKSGVYSFEQRRVELDRKYAAIFRRNRSAWAFYQKQPPGYRKTANWWVTSAKRETTRLARLEKLIEHSAAGERIPPLQRPGTRKK